MKSGNNRNSGIDRTAESGMNQNAWREGKLQVFGNIGYQKKAEMKEKNKNWMTNKHLETKFCCRNHIKGKNTWVVLLVSYLGRFLKWTREEPKQIDQRRRKLMNMNKTLHPRDDVNRLEGENKRKRNDKPILGPCWRTEIKMLNMRVTVIPIVSSSLRKVSKAWKKRRRKRKPEEESRPCRL